MSGHNRRNWLIGAALAALLAAGACGGGGGGSDEAAGDQTTTTLHTTTTIGETTTTLPPASSWVAEAKDGVAEVAVYAEPDAAEPVHRLANPKRIDGEGNVAPLVFLVDGMDVEGEWLRVHLPVPPNGSKGFVRAGDVELYTTDYRITVELTAHQLTLTKGREPVIETTVGLGRAGRETPAGLYFITELLRSPNPAGAYGPYAYGISGFQDDEGVRAEFGGEAVIGIHGTNQPDRLGEAVSSGCIRVHNDVITEIAGMLPLGVPVEVIP